MLHLHFPFLYTFSVLELNPDSIFNDRSKYFAIKDMKKTLRDHYQSYIVVNISFAEQRPNAYNDLVKQVGGIMAIVYRKFIFLLNRFPAHMKDEFNRICTKKSDETEIQSSLMFLINLLHEVFGKQIVLLIDEYDSILNHCLLSKHWSDKERDLAVDYLKGLNFVFI